MRIFSLILALLLLNACAVRRDSAAPDPSYQTSSSEKQHHTGRGFQNVGDFLPSSGANWRKLIVDPFSKNYAIPANHVLSLATVKAQIRHAANKQVSITWIGHSTFLIRLGKRWILTDPLFSARASPLRNVGPKRSVAAALSIAELPKIDAIVISHNHYDHLDGRAMRELAKLNPDTVVMVPLGNGTTVRRFGFSQVRELDWFDKTNVFGVNFTAVPAVHSSRRGFFNFNKALWSGWSISGKGKKIYFAGDTGFGSFIHDIRRVLGRHDVALVPIGAYRPPEIESAFHSTPEQAMELGRIIGARHIISMHWGTIALTAEPFSEQKSRFIAASRGRRGVHLLKVGATLGLY